MRKIIFLTTLCLPLVAGAARAQNFGGGRGTVADPLRISTLAHIKELATMVNGGTTFEGFHFRLTADLTGITTVIGKSDKCYFSGTFDGDGHTVVLNITSSFAGLFGCLVGATIKNTKVSGNVVTVYSHHSRAGGICGMACDGTTITNCHNTGNISAFHSTINSNCTSYAGGICGEINKYMHDMIRESRDCVIRDCYNTGNISAYNNAGGICGHNRESGVINCHNTGNISASYDKTFDSYAGGICGDGGDISNCYNTGDISAVHNAGGICGDNGGISDCYNTGNISAKGSNAGGICGRGGDIRNCYNTGDISSAENAGGICGKGGRISNCFAANATVTSYEGRRISSGSGYINITNCHALISMKINGLVRRSIKSDSRDGVDAELAEFKDRSWITSVLKWDFADTWTMPADGGLPKLSQRTP